MNLLKSTVMLIALSSTYAAGGSSLQHTGNADAIAEAVIRSETLNCFPTAGRRTFYSNTDMIEGSLSKNLRQRLAIPPPVKNWKEARKDKDKTVAQLFITVNSIGWKSSSEVDVRGYCFASQWVQERFTYSLVRENASWKVKNIVRQPNK